MKGECKQMEKYEKVEMEVIVFDSEDIITTSGDPVVTPEL